MRALCLWAVFVVACSEDRFGTCPTTTDDWSYDCRENVPPHTSCTRPQRNDAGTELSQGCTCTDNGFWVCNSCPFFWTPLAPPPPCTPGTQCVINSWEHGCSCGCKSDGTWSCYPVTVGSRCPGGSDAGV